MSSHGFTDDEILESLAKFDKETNEEQKKYETLDKFNEAILNAKGLTPLAKICKGIFVGNILLKNAREQKHPYLLATSEEFIIVVPYGPIQSIIHLLAIPKEPMYNAVSLSYKGVILLRRMKGALVKVVTDILTPGSIPQKLYLKILSNAIDRKTTDISSIRITQESRKLDTEGMTGAQASDQFRDDLNNYSQDKTKNGISLNDVVCTDLHIHDTNTVGQLHLHGWVADKEMITDNGQKLLYKNTPVDRIIPLLVKHIGEELPKSEIVVKIQE